MRRISISLICYLSLSLIYVIHVSFRRCNSAPLKTLCLSDITFRCCILYIYIYIHESAVVFSIFPFFLFCYSSGGNFVCCSPSLLTATQCGRSIVYSYRYCLSISCTITIACCCCVAASLLYTASKQASGQARKEEEAPAQIQDETTKPSVVSFSYICSYNIVSFLCCATDARCARGLHEGRALRAPPHGLFFVVFPATI